MAYSVCHAPLKLCEMLPVIQTVRKCDVLKSIIHSLVIQFYKEKVNTKFTNSVLRREFDLPKLP